MSFTLSEFDISDAESIAQHIEVPAMQNGPLYRTMFPRSTIRETQREEIIRWYVEMLEDAFQNRWESLLKACSADSTPVGFCGWTIIERNREHQVEAEANEKEEKRKKAIWVPETIDIDGWITVSKKLEDGA